MNDVVEKIKIVERNILAEKNKSTVLVALISRLDFEPDKWDLIFSADWIEENNSEKDLVLVIDKLKEVFSDGLDFLSQLVLLKSDSIFISLTAKAINDGNLREEEEFFNVKLLKNITLRSMIPVKFDLSKFNFSEIDLIATSLEGDNSPPEQTEEF